MAAKTRTCSGCPKKIEKANISGLCVACYRKREADAADARRVKLAALQTPEADRSTRRFEAEIALLKRKYGESLSTIDVLTRDLDALKRLDSIGVHPTKIAPLHPSGTSEGTVVLVASDWHVEERVDPSKVSNLNIYNTEIAKSRADMFFAASLRLIRLLQQDIKIDNVVLALLGDFISNQIHEEFAEINELQPTHAIVFAQDLIVSGIEFLLNNSKVTLTIPCHSGNHGRTTKTTRFGAENGHSLEYLMYLHLAAYFRNEPRVKFQISDGYHSYLDVYDKTLRFHHGHAIRYAGGIGGIFIPAFKAISQWDKAHRADLDIFGHFHQMKDGGNFVSNGSLIGFNAFALSIKADYEPPRQTLLLLDKKRGRTCTWPIWFPPSRA